MDHIQRYASPQKQERRAFTLIELLLVIAVISGLSAIVIVAINPAKQLGGAEDTRRNHAARELEKALFQYLIDYEEFPGNPAIPEGAVNALPVCRASFAESGIGACVNLDLLVSLRYLSCLPRDGSETDPERSGFSVYTLVGRPEVRALHLGEAGEGTCEILPEPFAYWKLDEAGIGDTVADASGNGHSGTHTGITSPDGPNRDKPGTVFENAGSVRFAPTDYVNTGIWDVTGNKLTLTAWYKADSFPEDPRVISKSSGTNLSDAYWLIGINDSSSTTGIHRFRLNTSIGGTATIEAGAAVTNVWTHLAATYDGTKARLFLSGVEIASTPKTGTLRTGGTSVWLGANPPTPSDRPFDGFLDEIRVYNTALTGSQILSLAQGNP